MSDAVFSSEIITSTCSICLIAMHDIKLIGAFQRVHRIVNKKQRTKKNKILCVCAKKTFSF